MAEPAPGMLAGTRVLDLGHFLAGPYAALALADLGADVIKVEDPDRLDAARDMPPLQAQQSLYFASLNWAKRSFAVRLATDGGRAALMDLVQSADVVIDNFRPGVTAKLGVDHDACVARNPGIVTCSLSGFGETGPYATRPGYDYTIQALAGVMSVTGDPDQPPGKAGISYVDHAGGLAAALGVCAALVERGRTGVGRHIDLGLFDVQVSMLTYLASWQLNAGHDPGRTPSGGHPSIVPAQRFATADGHLTIFVGNDPMWARMVAVAGEERLADARFATGAGRREHRLELVALLDGLFARRATADWVALLSGVKVPCEPVNSIAAALADPQVAGRDLVATDTHPAYGSYRHARGPLPRSSAADRPAPLLGEHTRELLLELGRSAGEVAALAGRGDILAP